MIQAARDLIRDSLREQNVFYLIGLCTHIVIDTLQTAVVIHREKEQSMTIPNYMVGQLTDTGLLRPRNEDAILSRFIDRERDRIGLFVVADGLGGHQDGDKASKIAVRTISERFEQNITFMPVVESLIQSVQQANDAIREQLDDSGAAVTAVALDDLTATIAQVGDTRAYLIHEGQLQQLTHDHTLTQHLLDKGEITPEEAVDHPMSDILVRSLGHLDDVDVDVSTHTLPDDARLLLCSDGLWKYVEHEKILDLVTQDISPQEACGRLIALANHRGGQDNVTAILVTLD
jgi:serine/threonine protein phosphatase PrpC